MCWERELTSRKSVNQLQEASLDSSKNGLDLSDKFQNGLDVDFSDVKLSELENQGKQLGDDHLQNHAQVRLEGSENREELLDIDLGDVGNDGF